MLRAMPIIKDLSWVGVLDASLRVFDIFIPASQGSSYNSYLLRGSEKNAIIEGVHGRFTEQFLEKIQSEMPLDKIDYLIVNHTEPDHSGAIARLLEAAPQIEIVASRGAATFLRAQLNREANCRIVSEGDTLSLGDKTLRFMMVPFWHWPDTMFTYWEEEKILFPCDGFGSHFADERMFNDIADDFWMEFSSYYDHIMRPFADKILAGCEKVRALELQMICPSHGPILRSDIWRYVDAYEEWSRKALLKPQSAAVIYTSAYGNTRRLAEAVAEGVRNSGGTVKLLDAAAISLHDAQAELESVQVIFFGSPTINGDAVLPIWNAISATPLLAGRGKMSAACFGSYGWSGEACGQMIERLKGLRYNVNPVPFKVNFVPTGEDLQKASEWAADFLGCIGEWC